MSVFVIRHAEKVKGEYYSDGIPLNNQPLSEFGKKQAANLVNYFENIAISSIFISEYIRTKETIAEVANLKKISPIIDKRLNEINTGDAENITDEQFEKLYPSLWKSYLERNRDFKFPNGESGDEAGDRVYEMFRSLDPANNHILIAHDGIIRTLICKVLALPTYKRHLFRIDLCSITIFEFSAEFKCWTISRTNAVI